MLKSPTVPAERQRLSGLHVVTLLCKIGAQELPGATAHIEFPTDMLNSTRTVSDYPDRRSAIHAGSDNALAAA